MIFLSSWLFFVVNCFVVVFHWIKYGLYRLFTPITKWEMQRRLNKIGVKINGKNSWDIQVFRQDAYARAGTYYMLGFGEAYMDASITVEDITELTYRAVRSKHWRIFNGYSLLPYFNMQTKSRAFQVGKEHYDIGNDLFEAMLDPYMNYTCGYWRNASNLEEAQLAKMDLIARKLMLKPGMRVLDLGCGFGGLARYMAEKYGVEVVGITISVEQAKYAKEKFNHPNVDIQVLDYRDFKTNVKFDAVAIVGMMEHVGEANYTTLFNVVKRNLKDEGIFLLHTIGVCDKDFPVTDPFCHKYIFVNAAAPRQRHITKYIDGIFYIEDWHNFGYDYSKTLEAWAENFEKAWPKLQSQYPNPEIFYRMWTFYLKSAIGLFRSRRFNLWHIVMSKNGLEGGYLSVR